jgi:putative protease
MKSPLYVAAVTDFYRSQISNIEQGTAECRRNNKPLRGGVPDGRGGFSVSASDDLEARLSDIQTIFGRPSTDLYLEDSENSPVDPVNDGHRGAWIGTVKAVDGSWLILHSNRALQKHDGLKVEMAGETSAYGFAANEMRLASDPESKRRFELPADADIALKLPADVPRLEKGAAVYCSYSQAVRQRYEFTAPRPGQFRQRKPVNIQVFQTLEEMKLIASADGIQTELVLSGPFEPARQPEKSETAIRQCFEKLGDTDWKLGELVIEGLAVFIPVSVLNDARRRLIANFSELWKQNPPRPAGTPPAEGILNVPLHGRGGRREVTDGEGRICWSVKSRCFQALEHVDEFVLEIDPDRREEIGKARAFYADKLRLALPVIIREEEAAAFRKVIDSLPDQQKWEAANVGGLNLLQGRTDITADWPLYTLNTHAALQWREQGVGQFVLSPEDDADNWFTLIEQLGGAAVVPVYQHTPLMISATKPSVNTKTPAEGSGPTVGCRPEAPTRRMLELTDRSRREFRVEQSGQEFVVTNETPFSLTGHLDELKAKGARRFRIDLSYGIDSPSEAAEIVQRIISGNSVSGHTGNFLRGLQLQQGGVLIYAPASILQELHV